MSAELKDLYIPTLDGLRAIAIVLVIYAHAVGHQNQLGIVGLGHLGVLIFFALSGFLITTRLLQEQIATGRRSLRNFYIRRIFRILPPSLSYLGVTSVLVASGLLVCDWPAIRSALFLYTNYVPIGDSGWKVGHFWSLAVEEHFYLFWPALMIASGIRKGWRTAAALAVAISVWRVLDDRYALLARLLHAPSLQGRGFRTDLIADTLLWGCCLAYFLLKPSIRALNATASTILALMSAAGMAVLNSGYISHVTFLLNFLPTVLLGSIVMAPRAPIGRFLELAPVRFVGRLSYSLYLWQQMFLGGQKTSLQLVVPLVSIFGCAMLSYYLVEKPSIAFGKKFLTRREPVVSPRAVAASN